MPRYPPRFSRVHLVTGVAASEQNVLAFPGARGFGRYSKGGRGGVTYYVTHLGDPRNGDPSEGSWRTAIEATGPRNVIFKVSGTINNVEPVVINKPYLSVWGQTAPGDGICISGEETRIQTNDVIIRHIRFRRGDVQPARDGFDNADALNIGTASHQGAAYNLYIDHCSMSWAIDETCTPSFRSHHITFDHCIFSEALFHSLHPEGPHSMGPDFGPKTTQISLLSSYICHNNQRNFQAAGGNIIQAVNNVIYNWGIHCVEYKNKDQRLDFIGNWVQYGPSTTTPPTGVLVVDETDVGAQFHAFGNRDPRGDESIDLDNWPMIQTVGGDQIPDSFKDGHWYPDASVVDAPFVLIERADLAKLHTLAECGATKPKRDSVDTRVVNDCLNGTGAIIDSQADVGGWPLLSTYGALTDSDDDGMPDWWEDAHGLNRNLAADANVIEPGQPYTWLERYSHYLAGDPGAT